MAAPASWLIRIEVFCSLIQAPPFCEAIGNNLCTAVAGNDTVGWARWLTRDHPGNVGATKHVESLNAPCPAGSNYDGANCNFGKAPAGTKAFTWGGNFYHTPLPPALCPPPARYDGA